MFRHGPRRKQYDVGQVLNFAYSVVLLLLLWYLWYTGPWSLSYFGSWHCGILLGVLDVSSYVVPSFSHHTSNGCGGAVGWGTALEAGSSRVRFPMVSFQLFFFWHMTLWFRGPLSLQQKWVGLTTLPSPCDDCLESWEPRTHGNLRACQDLYTDCFTLALPLGMFGLCALTFYLQWRIVVHFDTVTRNSSVPQTSAMDPSELPVHLLHSKPHPGLKLPKVGGGCKTSS